MARLEGVATIAGMLASHGALLPAIIRVTVRIFRFFVGYSSSQENSGHFDIGYEIVRKEKVGFQAIKRCVKINFEAQKQRNYALFSINGNFHG